MHSRRAGLLLLLLAGVTLSLTHGQDQRPLPKLQALPPTSPMPPAPDAVPPGVTPSPLAKPNLDFKGGPPEQQELLLALQRGANWLCRMNGDNGRFLYGWVPALKKRLEGDNYLHQAGAAFALARASRLTREDDHVHRATQAVLPLLDETISDPKNPTVRYTALPSLVINRLGAAGLLVLAINELPAPKKDLLDASEQLCNFIRSQARPDGSLFSGDPQPDGTPGPEEPEAVNHYPGMALYGLMLSQKHRPAPWKTDLVRKAVAYYHPLWRKQKNLDFAAWQSAAYTEAYLLTHEQVFADCVFDMADFLCGLQYEQPIPGPNPLDPGGFRGWLDGKAIESAPQISSACGAECLGHACRVARAAADAQKHKHYSESLQSCLLFLVRNLQYREVDTQHFVEWYRPYLLGGFHASHQDDNLRIDYAQHALSALVLYLEQPLR